MSEFKISGFDDTERNLRRLPEEIAGRVLSSALRTAAIPMAATAAYTAPRSDTPSRAGHAADSVKVRKFTDQNSGNDLEANVWIGPDRGHFYLSFAEWGTKNETARPFMRPAFDRDGQALIDRLGNELGSAVERAAKRLAG